jgi:hypothetical protein
MSTPNFQKDRRIGGYDNHRPTHQSNPRTPRTPIFLSFSTFSHPEMRGEETTPLPLLLHQEIDEVKLRPRAREVNYEVWRIG